MTTNPPAPDDRAAARVLDVLTRNDRLPDEPGWRVEVAPGGSTDRTFSVLDPAGEPRLTVRFARPGLAERLRFEQRILVELACEAAREAWTPRAVSLIEDAALSERWLLVHEHMPGRPAPLAGVSTAARERFGECLAWLHGHRRDGYAIWPALDAQQGTRAGLYRDRLATLRRYRSARLVPGAAALLDHLAAAELPPSAGWGERDFALCHGDLSIGNILWDGDTVALIDWEFARAGDSAEDLAYLASEQDLSSALIGEIADAYIAAGGDPWAFARLPAWLPLVALDAALWWADFHLAQGTNPVAQPDVSARLERARAFLPQ